MAVRRAKQKRSENKITRQDMMAAVQEWEKTGWTLLGIDRKDGSWAFKFGSKGRPRLPPTGIEPTSLFIYDDTLFCHGRPWDVEKNSIHSLIDWYKRYTNLLRKAKVQKAKRIPTPIAEDRQALNRSFADEHVRAQIKARTIAMAGSLGFLIRRP